MSGTSEDWVGGKCSTHGTVEEETGSLGDLVIDGSKILKCVSRCGLAERNPGWILLLGCCEHGNEPPASQEWLSRA
jgi:hypothetical protein